MVDGTTVSLPRTVENQAGFGVPTNQFGVGHFPVLRLVLLVGAGLVLDAASGPFGVSELALFLEMLQRLPAGGVWIGDSLYASYLNLALTIQRGSHVICCRHVNRRGDRVRRLTAHSHLERWRKPRPVHSHAPQFLPGLPEYLEIRVISVVVHRRGFRDYPLVLYTTLLDAFQYPDDQVVALYLKRWNIELDFRTLKCEHGLSRFSGKTPGSVLQELHSTLLAFNAVRAIQAETGQSPRLMSYARALPLVLDMALRMSATPPVVLPRLYQHLLRLIAEARVVQNARLPQPRAILKTRRYRYLSVSRSTWRAGYYVA
jgi:hypothetical protein